MEIWVPLFSMHDIHVSIHVCIHARQVLKMHRPKVEFLLIRNTLELIYWRKDLCTWLEHGLTEGYRCLEVDSASDWESQRRLCPQNFCFFIWKFGGNSYSCPTYSKNVWRSWDRWCVEANSWAGLWPVE